jgi:hypothetical protein
MRNVVIGNENKTNLRIWLSLSGDHRMKTYFMPVVTTHTGEPDVFNTGDIIDVEYEKTIRYYSN